MQAAAASVTPISAVAPEGEKSLNLTRDDILELKASKVLPDASFVYLALMHDGQTLIDSSVFAERWAIPEASLQVAIAQLVKKGVLSSSLGKMRVELL